MAHVCDLRPYPDHDTRHALDEAIEVLAIIRDLETTNPANTKPACSMIPAKRSAREHSAS